MGCRNVRHDYTSRLEPWSEGTRGSASMTTYRSVLEEIKQLPRNWHANGAMHPSVVEYIGECAEGTQNTVETGCGSSTLMLSRVSQRHLVFCCDVFPGDDPETHSLYLVKKSPVFNAASTDFVIGRNQLTVPQYKFDRQFDVVLIDGAHGYPFPELDYYYLYPHLKPGGWFILDDTHIPTVARMIDILKEDEMFAFDRVIKTTSFFRRTDVPAFPPTGDGWWDQGYNKRRFPALRHSPVSEWPILLTPVSVKAAIKRVLGKHGLGPWKKTA